MDSASGVWPPLGSVMIFALLISMILGVSLASIEWGARGVVQYLPGVFVGAGFSGVFLKYFGGSLVDFE